MSSVRFSRVVAECGKPQPYTLWLDPKNDPSFQEALKENRILSVHQETTGTKADYGEVGYTGAQGELLLFPKPLNAFEGQKVVGVKYDLLETPLVELRVLEKKKKSSEKPPPAPTPLSKAAQPKNVLPFAKRAEEAANEGDDTQQPPLRSLSPKATKPAPSPGPSHTKRTPLPRPTIRRKSPDPAMEEPAPTPVPTASKRQPEVPAAATEAPRNQLNAALSKNKTKTTSPISSAALPLLRKAMRALKDGKVVKAYESLQKLESLLS